MIHQAARDLAIGRLGEEEWSRLVEAGGLNGRHFIGFEYYSDADTMRLVRLIADRLGCSMAETFYLFGRTWIDFAGASAYGRVLGMAGGDLETFISNLDRMHASIKSNMPRASLPGFEVVESRDDAIHVLYRSEREGLAPFVQGILGAVAERFGERVRIDYEERPGGALFVLARQPVDA
ncbi:heme NO-binding domain-containing protein [Amaricoccus sp.]|uniref:heme NO-binding domain-containing protein n=1 Tax=Amaricoccus sp. TaxID=1872485 RepID=UPI0025C71977|nr:heme NO-binding domain-containing protein [Amaricoccus sp.]